MAIPNQKFREVVFQLLYSQDMGQPDLKDLFPMIMAELAVPKKVVLQAQEVVEKVFANCEVLDAKIAASSNAFDFERIYSVERNILRLGLYEMLFDDGVPAKVALSEAMRLAKKFSTADGRAFVNAIMDRILKETETQ